MSQARPGEEILGAIRWVPTTPNEASRNQTPTTVLATQTFKLQQRVEDEDGRESWEDVGIRWNDDEDE